MHCPPLSRPSSPLRLALLSCLVPSHLALARIQKLEKLAHPRKPLLKDEWPKEYRVTILDYTLDMAKLPININLHVTKPDEFPAVHPRVRNWAAKTVSTVLSIAVDKKITYTNPSPKEPQPRKHASTNLLEKMAVFVVEAKYDTAICGGKWPCIGWRRSVSDSKPAFYSMYPINPDVLEPKRLHFDGYKNQEEAQGKQFDIDFWNVFPRREFESKWPVLKEAIDHQHRERMAEVRKKKPRQGEEKVAG
ncbi:hypothetical protein BDP27DRAFT_1362491 [Rhodocollybia butyracea]|uniref:Uncharacterized protein n=1 Tax=Rhodocollybia butyracea TaxID=206335 RepID=A0A9P5PWE1_9AGAR|nr:hypothetical protein BDP27DRAFT_1362491 [Rhodocollybia butyracea]